jgi:hypothetical protein
MFEDRPMPPEPEDQIERLLAAEEADIGDNGFTQRVLDRAGNDLVRRKTVIYGAGLAGLGFALGGIVEMSSHLPNLSGWLDELVKSLSATRVEEAVRGASEGGQLAVVAILAGVSFLVAAVSLQNR